MEITTFKTKGIDVCLCNTKKFNTTSICLVQRVPLRRETVSSYSLIPRVLSRASKKHSSLRGINSYLEELGGAEFIPEPIKKGEEQIISFYITAPSEFTGKLFEFLSSTVYNPLTIEGGFMPSYVHNACNVAARELASKINDKRSYCTEKLIETMCKNEYFGICSDGYIKDFGDISGNSLYNSYKSLLSNGITQLYITGDITPNQAESYVNNHFEQAQSTEIDKAEYKLLNPHSPEFKTEEGGTFQSCLSIGIRADKTYYPKLLIANEILSGSASSRLFNNIREKEGLCYYISSSLYRYKGIIAIQAGIEENNAQKVTDAVDRELKLISEKGVSEKELTNAKNSLINSLKALEDYPARLMDYMLSLSVANVELSIENSVNEISAVDDIKGVFDTAFIDTVFLLKEAKNE